MKTNWKGWAKTVGFFTLIGPPLGWISMCACAIIAGIATGSGTRSDFTVLFLGMFTGSLFSYILGGIPALLTGMFVGLFRHRLNKPVFWFVSAAIGLLTTAFFVFNFSSDNWNTFGWEALFNPLTYMGAFSAFVCSWLLRSKKQHIPPPIVLKDIHET